MKLKSMVSFVLEQEKELNCAFSYNAFEFHKRVINYAKFLSQPLTLGMFIPCGEDGLPMEEPKPSDYFDVHIQIDQYDDSKGLDKYYSALMFWEAAKDRVLFDGFELISENIKNPYLLHSKTESSVFIGKGWAIRHETVEDLVDIAPTLTPTAVKQLKK